MSFSEFSALESLLTLFTQYGCCLGCRVDIQEVKWDVLLSADFGKCKRRDHKMHAYPFHIDV